LDCGATVCALVIVEDIAYVAHVGDTGAFLFYCDDPTIEPKWKSTRLYDEHSVHSERER
jgi:serine/threonine protein phosphatase PrpC